MPHPVSAKGSDIYNVLVSDVVNFGGLLICSCIAIGGENMRLVEA